MAALPYPYRPVGIEAQVSNTHLFHPRVPKSETDHLRPNVLEDLSVPQIPRTKRHYAALSPGYQKRRIFPRYPSSKTTAGIIASRCCFPASISSIEIPIHYSTALLSFRRAAIDGEGIGHLSEELHQFLTHALTLLGS